MARPTGRKAGARALSPRRLERQYRDALRTDVIPFWQRHSLDRECGGYFTCLDRKGTVYDTDKFVWLQARQVWMFSALYNRFEKRRAWLDTAKLGADFLRRHGRDAGGNWYFRLTRDGRPLVVPYNIFSDCFAAMAFSEYALASGDAEAKRIARETFRNVLRREKNPKGKWCKEVPGTRPLRAMVLSMVLANLAVELSWLLEKAECERILDRTLHEVMDLHVDADRLLTLENVRPDGSRADCLEGRLVSPGHGIEAMWFMMDVARWRNDRELIDRALEVALSLLRFGWDRKYGGIFYFMDAEGHPPDHLDWNLKLWWVHLETLVALLMGYNLTGRKACWTWFEKVHTWAWPRFRDPRYGEWYGYLDRRGEVMLPLKGGKWKGCFHVPRALYMCFRELQTLNGTHAARR